MIDRFRPLGWLVLVLVASATAALQAAPPPAEILKATNIPGGLIVHLGCGSGELTADLAGANRLVQGLDKDAGNVEAARKLVSDRGLYGPVSIEHLSGSTLPYADNLVNLIIVDDASGIARDEINRVLAPGGVAYAKAGGKWQTTTKQRPTTIDEWTHFLHGPDGNAVAHDKAVGPPQFLQWIAGPRFSRGHEQQASFSSCVTAGGRMFYIVDEAPTVDIRMPPEWKLVCRDAFNGVVLWKRDIGEWVNHLRRFRSGPASLQFRAVADRDRLFVTLAFDGPLSVLDARTGKTLMEVPDSNHTKQMLHADGSLTLLIDEQVGKIEEIDVARRRGEFIPRKCRILNLDDQTGKLRWSHDVDELVFPCLATRQGRLFGRTPTRVFALDAGSGKPLWSIEQQIQLPIPAGKANSGEMQWEAPTLVAGDKAVYLADFKSIRALNADDGSELWQEKSSSGYNSPPDLHLIEGLLWMPQNGSRVAVDPATGKVQKSIKQLKGYMHDRCYRNKATDQFMMLGVMGVQMLDLENGQIHNNDWIRGTCQYGILPANGLLYVPPDSCACNMKSKLSGVYALSSQRGPVAPAAQGFEKGPAFGSNTDEKPAAGEWPTFRASPGRTGTCTGDVDSALQPQWSTQVGGKLSGVVAAGGRVYVAAVDQHAVHCLEAASGKPLWTFVAGARIDSPPTIYKGCAYFGSADGWIYAVRAKDGVLAWRRQLAPETRMTLVLGQLESSWPVHGSVLVQQGELKVAAGRSSYLDGGIRLYRLKPETGDILSQATIFSPDPATGSQPAGGGKDVRGTLSDILVADGDDVFMRHTKLNFETGDESGTGVHLFSPIGLLDDTWWHRSYWLMSDEFVSHWSGWWQAGNHTPSGRILSYDSGFIYGYGRDRYPSGNTGQFRGGEHYQLFAVDRHAQATAKPKKDRRGRPTDTPTVQYQWSKSVPLLGTALAVTDTKVLVAGPPDIAKAKGALELENPEDVVAAWRGQRGGLLYVAARDDGRELATLKLDSPPVFDGMAVSAGRVYLATRDGRVRCLGVGDK